MRRPSRPVPFCFVVPWTELTAARDPRTALPWAAGCWGVGQQGLSGPLGLLPTASSHWGGRTGSQVTLLECAIDPGQEARSQVCWWNGERAPAGQEDLALALGSPLGGCSAPAGPAHCPFSTLLPPSLCPRLLSCQRFSCLCLPCSWAPLALPRPWCDGRWVTVWAREGHLGCVTETRGCGEVWALLTHLPWTGTQSGWTGLRGG